MRQLAIGLGLLVASAALLWTALQAPRIAVPEREALVVRGVTLLEPGAAARPGHDLWIRNGRIEAIAPSGRELAAPGAREARDLAGLTVAPGLIDMHVHYPPAVAVGNRELWSLLLLAHGVTSVREMGSIDGSIFSVRDAIRVGEAPGPRIFACGAILDGESPSFPSNRVVRDAEEARRAVRDQAARGADCIKAYNMLGPGALAAIRSEAKAVGLPVIGHAPHSVPFEVAGLVDLQHGTGAVPIDRAKVGRLDFRDEDWESLSPERIAYVAAYSRSHGIAHTPTLVNGRLRRLLADERAAAQYVAKDTAMRHLPAFWVGVWSALWSAPYAIGDVEGEAGNARFLRQQDALTLGLHAAGARLHAGTDTLMPYVAPGSSLHGELALLERAGIDREEVWRIATREAGDFLGTPGLGTIAPGAPADLLFLRADPRAGLENLRELEAVLADGRLYRRADFETALARMDAHFESRLYRWVMGAVVGLVQRHFAPD